MEKHYLVKFKSEIDYFKKEEILTKNKLVNVLETFEIYIIELDIKTMFSLKKDKDILYVKESKQTEATFA